MLILVNEYLGESGSGSGSAKLYYLKWLQIERRKGEDNVHQFDLSPEEVERRPNLHRTTILDIFFGAAHKTFVRHFVIPED